MQPHPLVSLLAPPGCAACTKPTAPSQTLCGRCNAALAAAVPGSSVTEGMEVRWAGEYAGVARDLIRALKFSRRTSAVAPIATAMAPLITDGVALVPVPASPWRRRVRGLDPAEEITLALARQLDLEVEPCLRRGRGPRQVGRSRADRLSDPPRVRRDGPIPAVAMLIDDVFTTGATLAACARALGDSCLGAVVFARASPIAERSEAEVRRR